MPLHHAATGAPAVLHQTPVSVGLAVFSPFMAAQEQGHARDFTSMAFQWKGSGLHYSAFRASAASICSKIEKLLRENFSKPPPVAKVGLMCREGLIRRILTPGCVDPPGGWLLRRPATHGPRDTGLGATKIIRNSTCIRYKWIEGANGGPGSDP